MGRMLFFYTKKQDKHDAQNLLTKKNVKDYGKIFILKQVCEIAGFWLVAELKCTVFVKWLILLF